MTPERIARFSRLLPLAIEDGAFDTVAAAIMAYGRDVGITMEEAELLASKTPNELHSLIHGNRGGARNDGLHWRCKAI